MDDMRANLGDGSSDVDAVNGRQIRHDETITRVSGYKVERVGHNSTRLDFNNDLARQRRSRLRVRSRLKWCAKLNEAGNIHFLRVMWLGAQYSED